MKKLIKCLIIAIILLTISPAFASEDTLITVDVEKANIQVSPTSSQVIYQLPKDTQLNYITREGSWFKINHTLASGNTVTGYIHASSVHTKLDKRLELIVELAHRQIGKPYRHVSGPDAFDCSGLIRWLYAHVKDNNGKVIYLSTIPNNQYKHITYQISRQDVLNAFTNNTLDSLLQPGDALYLKGSSGTLTKPGHVALYIGNGQIIHAKGTKYGVVKEDLTAAYLKTHLVSASRIIDADGNVHVDAYTSNSTTPIKFPDDMGQLYY